MTTRLPRHLWRWILSLELSLPVKHVRRYSADLATVKWQYKAHFDSRDFANGYLFAEIFSRYFPRDIHIHSFVNVSSNERKTSNWKLLSRFFKVNVIRFPLKNTLMKFKTPMECSAPRRLMICGLGRSANSLCLKTQFKML